MLRVAVLIPCLNEEKTIGDVVKAFAKVMPGCSIHVCDNGSTDQTLANARKAGAQVMTETRRGKGYAVQKLFRLVDADIYLMVDGDATYPPDLGPTLVDLVATGAADMANASRMIESDSRFRVGNRFGNQLFANLVNGIFGAKLTDIFTGYRAMSREFVLAMPLFKSGFELEAEVTIKALDRGFSIVEIPAVLAERPEGSASKLKRVKDGIRILWTILALFRDYKPLTFFGGISLFLATVMFVLLFNPPGPSEVEQGRWMVSMMGTITGSAIFGTIGLVLHCLAIRVRELDSVFRSGQRFLRRSETPAPKKAKRRAA